MTLLIVTPSEAEPVTLEQAKKHCRVPGNGDDDMVTDQIAAAREWVEEFTRRVFVAREYELRLDAWPATGDREIVLPFGPLIEVSSVEYVDTAGVLQTLSPSRYVVGGEGADERGRVVSAPGYSWPAVQKRIEAVRVTFTAGHSEDNPAKASMGRALLLILGDLYEHRERTITGTIVATIDTCEKLLWKDRLLEAA